MLRVTRRAGITGVLLLALLAPACASNRDYPGARRPGWSLSPERTKVKVKERKEKKDKKPKKAQGKKRGRGEGRRGGE